MTDSPMHVVVVIGAGPAGLFAARALAAGGTRVVLLNRDIKPGGLAEYGIFLNKYRMKGGLRRQFQKTLTDPLITYLGHVTISNTGDLTVGDLATMGFDALVYAIGAQGTKYLGVDGEHLPGVFHAKDLVYHYNRLPPFSERSFPMGRRVAIVGVGNVMVDIANYCAHFADCDEIIAIARRGPFEKAYDDREFEDVEDAFDHALHREEIERIRPRILAAGQDPDELLAALAARPEPSPRARARLRFRFLASPRRVVADGDRVVGLEIEETRLERKGDRVTAVGTGETAVVPVDTVVFAVGDRVDEDAGLPYKDGLYLTVPGTDPAAAYQVLDPAAGLAQPGIFVVGWARRASDGVVGRARLDAETGIRHVAGYLAGRPKRPREEAERAVESLRRTLAERGATVVDYPAVQRLEAAERARATADKVEEFKFRSDREMLDAIRS
ncbi:MAG TPA: FAD-dependent oxidoreductase [Candidatus Limnocylindria bacterium]|nr:FAD-dependent oxidoreductase [Candidatus Limnocylindria bacterium]